MAPSANPASLRGGDQPEAPAGDLRAAGFAAAEVLVDEDGDVRGIEDGDVRGIEVTLRG